MSIARPALAGALALVSVSALAAEQCMPIAVAKAAIAGKDGSWVDLTPDQWQFLRGVYLTLPTTPLELPYGDRAAMALIPGQPGAWIFFFDGDVSCNPPLRIKNEFLTKLMDVGDGTIRHLGHGL